MDNKKLDPTDGNNYWDMDHWFIAYTHIAAGENPDEIVELDGEKFRLKKKKQL